MKDITADTVRKFLLERYGGQFKEMGLDPANVPDTFDFLLEGLIDSFGMLEMVSAMEKEFGLELDMTNLDADQMTVLGPLAHYVAQQAQMRRPASDRPIAAP